MAQQDDGGGEMDKALKVFRVVFVAHDEAAEVEQPAKQLIPQSGGFVNLGFWREDSATMGQRREAGWK